MANFPVSDRRLSSSPQYNPRAEEFSVDVCGLGDCASLCALEFREGARRNVERVFLERPLPGSYDLAVHDNRWVKDAVSIIRQLCVLRVKRGAAVFIGDRVFVVSRQQVGGRRRIIRGGY